MKLLLVEDEKDLARLIAKGFQKNNYAVDIALDGQEALFLFESNTYDCMILDINLPKIDGFDVLKKIRETNVTLPILILSARAEVQDRIHGLDLGSNDYLVKPFDFQELDARVRALLRRKFTQEDAVIHIDCVAIDTTKKIVTVHNNELKLTPKEYAIIEYLAKNPNAIVSSETLLEHVWDSNVDLFSNPLKYHIHSIKKKFQEANLDQPLIENVRGQGYRLIAPGDTHYE